MASKVDKTMHNITRCSCGKCPTYTTACKIKNLPTDIVDLVKGRGDLGKIEHLEYMFCAYGKSNCIDEKKGCICGNCPVHKDYDLHEFYYCIQTGGM